MPEGSPDRHPPLGGDGHDEVGLPAPHRLLHRVPARGQVDTEVWYTPTKLLVDINKFYLRK